MSKWNPDEHLPECYMREPFTIDRPGLCICDRLHACEQRVQHPAISTPDGRNAGTEQIAEPALHKSPREDR